MTDEPDIRKWDISYRGSDEETRSTKRKLLAQVPRLSLVSNIIRVGILPESVKIKDGTKPLRTDE